MESNIISITYTHRNDAIVSHFPFRQTRKYFLFGFRFGFCYTQVLAKFVSFKLFSILMMLQTWKKWKKRFFTEFFSSIKTLKKYNYFNSSFIHSFDFTVCAQNFFLVILYLPNVQVFNEIIFTPKIKRANVVDALAVLIWFFLRFHSVNRSTCSEMVLGCWCVFFSLSRDKSLSRSFAVFVYVICVRRQNKKKHKHFAVLLTLI